MGHTVEVQIFMKEYYVTEKIRLQNGGKLQVNDEITQVNAQALRDNVLQKQFEEPIKLGVQRAGKEFTVECTVQEWKQIQQKMSNVTDGIGTLTYVTEDLQHFGALGHKIQLRNNGKFDDGFIHLATIQSVVKSEKNTPGYKIIHPTLALQHVGQLTSNQSVGIFGSWQQRNLSQMKPMETATAEQIVTGEAQMLTQVTEDKIESFTINITKVEGEQFYFTVKDQSLVKKTGGVIQGMSGSPVIQNERIIGAVTHMFVEDPKKGVAITIGYMMENSKR